MSDERPRRTDTTPLTRAESRQLATDGAGRDGAPSSLIVVSNRQPYRHEYEPPADSERHPSDGETPTTGERSITVDEPAGGLTAGLDPVVQATEGTWIAWGDGEADFEVTDDQNRVLVPPGDESYTLRRIDLSDAAVDAYYYGFSNRVLWPLCHEFPDLVEARPGDLEWYRRVNERFAEAVAESATDESVVWIQDYHFAFAPRLVSESTPPSTTVAQFWHIPWPTPTTFGGCPAAGRVLEGVLGNDLLAFHVDRYVDHFLESVDRFLPTATVDYKRQSVSYDGSVTRVVATAMGVDAQSYDEDARAVDPTDVRDLLADLDIAPGTVIGLGLDRLDYSKGIPERLAGIERFFERYPEWNGAFTFVQKATPSRTDIPTYERYGEIVTDEIERINDRFETTDWSPIVYTDDYLSADEIAGLYRRADVMLVTPLLDGMNLVAQEFVASSVDEDGVLVLSDRTGVYERLGSHALAVDPTDPDGIADQLAAAVTMAPHERRKRMQLLRARVFDGDLEAWMDEQFEWMCRIHSEPASGRDRHEHTPSA